jgi:hypothetical protein
MSLASEDPVEDWASNRAAVSGHRAEILEEAHVPAPDGAPDPLDDDAPLWMVESDDAACWAMRKIGRANRELLRVEQVAEYEIAGIRQWLDEVSSPLARTVGFFEAKLVEYRRRLEDENPDLPATYRLPGGDITRRAGRVRSTVTDSEAFTAWALANAPEAVALKPLTSPLKSDRFTPTAEGALVDTTTGELVPGVQVSQGPVAYGVKVR